MASSKQNIDPNLLRVVTDELLQLHCQDVSWEKASDKIPLELVRYLLGDLVQYLSTLGFFFFRGNRCVFLKDWPKLPNSAEAWNYMLENSLERKTSMEIGHYRFTYMLSNVGPKYDDLVEIYCPLELSRPQFQSRRYLRSRNISFLRAP